MEGAISELTRHFQRLVGCRMVARIGLRACATLCFALLSAALATAQAHVAEPTVNLGDTSFLDAVGGPGLLIEEIGDGYASTTPSVSSIAGLTHIAWLGNQRILNAWYGVELAGVAAHVNVSGAGNAGGWGDLTAAPLILQWKEREIGRVRIDQRLAFDFGLPIGAYKQSSGVNLGSNAFAVHPYYAITIFPGKRIETSWRVHYLWNARNNTPSLARRAQSTQAGQAVHFNATLGYKLPHGFWIGANGYYLRQITAPRIDGVGLRHSPEQVGAIGPGAVWHSGRCFLYANAYHELGVENRSQGERLVLRMEWIFGRDAGGS